MKSLKNTTLRNPVFLKQIRNLGIALALGVVAAPLSAQTFYWNPTGSGSQAEDGSGNLTEAVTWWNGTTNTQWSGARNAVIGVVGAGAGSSYTLTNNGANWTGFQVNQLTFRGGASYAVTGNSFNVRDGISLEGNVGGAQTIGTNVSFGRGAVTATSITNNSTNASGIFVLSSGSYLAPNNAATGGSLSFGGTGTGTNRIEGTVRQTGAGLVDVSVSGSSWLFSGNNSHQGRTNVSGGVAILGSATTFAGATGDFVVSGGALQTSVANTKIGGNLELSSGSIEINTGGVGILTIASGSNFVMEGGIVTLVLGSSFDQFVSEGDGIFAISGGTLLLDVTGSGFSYDSSYELFSGFLSGSVVGLDIQGYDSARYTAVLSNSGVLSFTAIPEPAAFAQVGVVLAGVLLLLRKRLLKR